MRLIVLFLFIAFNSFAQLPAILNNRNQSAPTELGRIEWLYNSTDYSGYITTSPLWTDTNAAGSLTTGNVLGIWTVGANNSSGANTGLCYNYSSTGIVTSDEVCYKRYNTGRFVCIAKSNLTVGTTTTTIPPPGSIDITMTGTQGVDIDPIGSKRIFECLEGSQEVRITNISGTEIERFSVAGDGATTAEPNTLSYDYVKDVLYVTYQSRVNIWKKIGSTWTKTGVLPFSSSEGNSPNQIDDRFVANRDFSNGFTRITEQDLDGWYNRIYPLPGNAMADNEGIIFDPRSNLVWFNSDQNFHGGISNGNRLYLLDPGRVYQKKLFFPGMIRYDKFKLASNSTIVGNLNDQRIRGYDFSLSPVIDFIAYTENQTLSNFVSSNSAYDVEFRGSNTAPTTTSENSGHLDFYDANQTNDGWGSTVPSSWSSSIANFRYIQFRIRSRNFVEVDEWTPADLGTKLKMLFIMNGEDGIWYDAGNGNRVERVVNKYNPTNSLRWNPSSGVTSIPTFSIANGYASKTNLQYWTLTNPTPFLLDTQGEIGFIARSGGGISTNQLVAFAATNQSTTTGIFRVGHYRSTTDTFINAWNLTVVDGAGTTSRIGFVDTDHSSFPFISFTSNSSTTKGYKNAVEQTLTTSGGSNTGKWIDDATGATVIDVGTWRTNFTANVTVADFKLLIYCNPPMTDPERLAFYNWTLTNVP